MKLFDATSRFHNPANAAAWADPGTNEADEAVRSLVLAGLARSTSAPKPQACGDPHK